MRLRAGVALIVAVAAAQASAVTLIGSDPNVNDGGLTVLGGAWTRVGEGPDLQLDDNHSGISPDDGADWRLGGSNGTGCSPSYDLYYSQIFSVGAGQIAAGQNVVYLSGWAKAYAGWWSGENWGWVQEAHIELWADGVPVVDMMSSNNQVRDQWEFWVWSGVVTVTDQLEVRLHAIKGPGNYNPGNVCGGEPYSAIWYDSRFDDITLQAASLTACPNPPAITGLSTNTTQFTTSPEVQTLTVEGANLGGMTGMRLIGPVMRNATNVLATDTQVSADFDLSNAPRGVYHVITRQDDPCVNAVQLNALTILPGPFANGGFEAGDAGNVADLPGWRYVTDHGFAAIEKHENEPILFGDVGHAFEPTEGPPSKYAGNTHHGEGKFLVGLAQTFVTTPGVTYSVRGGYFGGVVKDDEAGTDGTARWAVVVVDGDSTNLNAAGTVIAEQIRPANGGYYAFRERFAGEFTANGTLCTMFLIWGHDGGTDATHMAGWDALTVLPSCHLPFADADGDHDVDQADFGVFQTCFGAAGEAPLSPPAIYRCYCFDRELPPDGDVDIDDLTQFLNCVTGPGVWFDVENPPPGCTP